MDNIDARDFATVLLKLGAWMNMIGGIVLCVYLLATDAPVSHAAAGVYDPVAAQLQSEANTLRIVYAVGWFFAGLLGWAACYVLAQVSDESREMHHIIDKMTRSG